MKKFLVMAAAAAAMLIGVPQEASAHSSVRVYLGIPHYSYRVGPDYRFRAGYGWYRPGVVVGANRFSCAAAKSEVRSRGYRNVSTVECGGSTYTFRAERNGKRMRVYVNARTGAVWRG